MQNDSFKLTRVMPVCNERETIVAAIDTVLAPPYDKEILVADDGSSDGTHEVLARSNDPAVKVILHEKNMGKGGGLRSGFALATGDIILIQDADLESDPGESPVLLGPILAGKADVVYGSRFAGHGAYRALYFWDYVGNRFLTLVSNLFANLNLSDMETCYKVFTRAKRAKKNLRISEVPISCYGRTYEQGKKIGRRDGGRPLWCILRYNIFAN